MQWLQTKGPSYEDLKVHLTFFHPDDSDSSFLGSLLQCAPFLGGFGRPFLFSFKSQNSCTNKPENSAISASFNKRNQKKKISSLGLLFLGINWIKLVQNCSLSISTLVSVGLSRMIGLQDLDDTRISQCGGITQVLSAEESLEHRGNPVLTKRKIEEDMGMDIDFYFEI